MDSGNSEGLAVCILGVLATADGLAKTCLWKWHFCDIQICLVIFIYQRAGAFVKC